MSKNYDYYHVTMPGPTTCVPRASGGVTRNLGHLAGTGRYVHQKRYSLTLDNRTTNYAQHTAIRLYTVANLSGGTQWD